MLKLKNLRIMGSYGVTKSIYLYIDVPIGVVEDTDETYVTVWLLGIKNGRLQTTNGLSILERIGIKNIDGDLVEIEDEDYVEVR